MSFEDDLRAALRREPAPENFAAEILRRSHKQTPRRRLFLLPLAAVLATAALIPPALQYRDHHRAIEARDQLAMALTITQSELEHTRQKIRANVRHRQ